MKRWWLVLLALLCAAGAWAADSSKQVYRNTPWYIVPPDGVVHYQLVPIPSLSAEVVSYKLYVNADNGPGAPPWQGTVTLKSDKFSGVCFVAEFPVGTQIGDAAWNALWQTADGFEAIFVYRVPSGRLTDGEERREPSYVIEPGKQLFLVSVLANTGVVPLGPVTCVAQVYFKVPR